MTSFKLVKYIPRIKKKKSGPRKLARKVPTDRLLKFERVFKVRAEHYVNTKASTGTILYFLTRLETIFFLT